MKYAQKLEVTRNGRKTWVLLDHEKQEVELFSRCCDSLINKVSANTFKTYANNIALFINAFIGLGGYEENANPQEINSIISFYLEYLVSGSDRILERYKNERIDKPRFIQFCKDQPKGPIKPTSISNKVCAISYFLRISEQAHQEELSRNAFANYLMEAPLGYQVSEMQQKSKLSKHQAERLRKNTMFAGASRAEIADARAYKRLSIRIFSGQLEAPPKAFPLNEVFNLIDNASCLRDAVFWLLLAATGARCSEILLLKFKNINFERRSIEIKSPYSEKIDRKFFPDFDPAFKGREHSDTYLLPMFKDLLFSKLEKYMKSNEFIASSGNFEDLYVLQCLTKKKRGVPLFTVRHQALLNSFRKACKRAAISLNRDGKPYGLHSLRHTYGYYLVNDIPVDPEKNVYGMELEEVRIFMGHKNIESTKVYAIKDSMRLAKKLDASLSLFYSTNANGLLEKL